MSKPRGRKDSEVPDRCSCTWSNQEVQKSKYDEQWDIFHVIQMNSVIRKDKLT